jgi:hypothetical protein
MNELIDQIFHNFLNADKETNLLSIPYSFLILIDYKNAKESKNEKFQFRNEMILRMNSNIHLTQK